MNLNWFLTYGMLIICTLSAFAAVFCLVRGEIVGKHGRRVSARVYFVSSFVLLGMFGASMLTAMAWDHHLAVRGQQVWEQKCTRAGGVVLGGTYCVQPGSELPVGKGQR